ncbi:predicted GPI-anchored protein 58 [Malus sylvestris]|uniref:predicted GPI-anchored protein 58 n=1 Tax=Malus sylvestris TaxID=3752 RepID=UPI0021AD3B47|nr:predicted GPI-anchored protein 58 [Malus sylvestris]
MAKKGAREIHVISSHTTTPSASSPAAGHSRVEKQPASAAETTPARPASVAGASVIPPSVEKAPVSQQAVSTTEGTSPKNPKPSVLVLDESEGSDEVPLAHRPHTRRQPPPIPEMAVQTGPSPANRGKRTVEEPIPVPEPLVPSQDQGVPASSEAAAPVGPSAADRGKRLLEEPEATAESPVHPQDQSFHIPPQEVKTRHLLAILVMTSFKLNLIYLCRLHGRLNSKPSSPARLQSPALRPLRLMLPIQVP